MVAGDDRLKEGEEEEEEEEETVRRPIPSRQVTVGFRLSVAVDRSQQEMERYTIATQGSQDSPHVFILQGSSMQGPF
eukprot:scaffold2115_cov92-Amphora_coffeaeformis.AAC.2